MILNSRYTRHKQIKSYIPFSKWRNTNEKIFFLQTVLIVIKLFVLFTTYNQETAGHGAIPVRIGSVSGIAGRGDSSIICPVPDAETLPIVLFTTYNQETGRKNVVPDTEPFQ